MSDAKGPLFSLVNGEGVGALLAAAALDVATGTSSVGYSSTIQLATVISYHLMANDGVQGPLLARDWSELAADGPNPSVYRALHPDFEEWLSEHLNGAGLRHGRPSFEPASYTFPVGVWFRRHPDRLVEAAVEVSRITHSDAETAVAAAAFAGATAASCFAQTGRDLLAASADTAVAALKLVESEATFTGLEGATDYPARIRAARIKVPSEDRSFDRPTDLVLDAITIAAAPDSEVMANKLAGSGGGVLAVMVGALCGARLGIRTWSTDVPNATWFMEIGRRLVSAEREVRDLPVPYFVEESLTYGIDRDGLGNN